MRLGRGGREAVNRNTTAGVVVVEIVESDEASSRAKTVMLAVAVIVNW